MGGPGSGRKIGQPYRMSYKVVPFRKLFKQFQEKHPGEPFPLVQKDGTIKLLYKLPSCAKRKKNSVPRSNKGMTREQNRIRKQNAAAIGNENQYTQAQENRDLERTRKEIEYFEEQERIKAHEAQPHIIERRKEQKRAMNRKSYERRVVRARRAKVPADKKCPICSNEKTTSKQWVELQFKDQCGMICKSCYSHVRL